MGATINARMGLTRGRVVGTNDNAAIAGDVAMLANEVTPVLNALRRTDSTSSRSINHMRTRGRRFTSSLLGHGSGGEAGKPGSGPHYGELASRRRRAAHN